jgi:DNA repair protein RecO (recombination protein O)
MRNKTLKTSALVIRSINWSESSKIVSLYTRERGRIEVIAKGARRKNSTYRGVLETLNGIEAIIYFSSSRELQHLGQVSLENNFASIRSDLSKTAYAFAILELIYSLIHPREGDEVFYDFVYTMIEEINSHPVSEIIFWYFILKLASYLGFKPLFSECLECGKKLDSEKAFFQYKDGSLCCPSCSKNRSNLYILSDKYYTFFNLLQNTHYKQMDKIVDYPTPASKMTDFLMNYLNYHTGQQLNLTSLQLIVTN